MKSALGIIRSLFPVVYFGGLFFYFLDVCDGSLKEAQEIGLAPYLLGLAIIGLLFSIPLIIKLVWLLGMILGGRQSPEASPASDSGFDADAMIARYKAQTSTEGQPRPPSAPLAGPAKRSSFGRKIR